MRCCNAYESTSMRDALGETLRPGGFDLTERGVQFCGFSTRDSILDLGCGMGATIGYLYEAHQIKATGVEPSDKLIELARMKYASLDFVKGTGESIPLDDESFNGVFAECTMSLMKDLDSTLKEVFRVLKNDGWLVITDVYAKNPKYAKELEAFTLNSCMRGLHDLDILKERLEKSGFGIVLLEDHSHLLKQLLVKLVFSYGSMGAFWNSASDNCTDGCGFQEILKACKPGYFLLIARKGESSNE